MFFHYLCGKIAALEENLAVVDCGGVGFECAASSYTLAQLRMGEVQKIYTVCSVREDAFEIFGFATREEKRCFELLTSVGGVGPKVALNILSAVTPSGVQLAVATGDEKALTAAQGVGKKLAQRILLELKDKLSLEDAFEKKLLHEQEAEETLPDARGEAVEALTALGYSPADALRAVQKVEPGDDMDTEAILKAALKRMI